MARTYVPSLSPIARAMRGFGAPGVKPTVPVEIDWSHPLARNLFSFIIVLNDGSVFDLVSRRLVGEPSNTASEFIKRPVGKEGICYGTDTNSLSASFHTLLNADADTWDSATLACRRWSQRFDQSSYLLRVQNANAFTALTLRTATNETINLAVENNLSMLSRRSSATSFSGFKWRTFAGDWDGSDGTINLYIDGQDDSAAGYMNGPNSGSVTNPTDRVIGIGPQKWHDKEFDSWAAVWRNRVLSAEQHRQIDENIYQLLKPANAAPFLVGTAAAAGGDVTAALTGVSASGSVGTFTVSGDALFALTGVSTTGQLGTLTVQTGGNVVASVTGVSATGQIGTLTLSAGASVQIVGVSTTGQVGTVTVQTTAAGDVIATITGVDATGQVGTLQIDFGATVAPTGVQATGQVGTVTVSIVDPDVSVSISGVHATGQVGTVTVISGSGVWTEIAEVTTSWSNISPDATTWTERD